MARILIIDDDKAVRRSVRRILEKAGHELDEAEDGFAGMALHATRPFDLIITDLRMPGFDGIAVITSLRRIDPAVKIILISGGGDHTTTTQVADLGLVWVQAKPFSVQQLQNLVQTVLDKSESG
jgi:DNA-binding NtrC family response regulator